MTSKINLLVGTALVIALTATVAWHWNPFSPKDYEECAERSAREAKSKESLGILISSCDSNFVARRRLGGGYTYYDSRQSRSFDILGPNPGAREIEYINKELSAYIKQQQQSAMELAALERDRLNAQADAERDRLNAQAGEERRRQIALTELQRRKQAAVTQFQLVSQSIECKSYDSCTWYRLTVSFKNGSRENISSISLGWVFFSMTDEKCPSSLPTRKHEIVSMRPNDTTTVSYQGFDGPEAKGPGGKFIYCVRVTDAEIGQ